VAEHVLLLFFEDFSGAVVRIDDLVADFVLERDAAIDGYLVFFLGRGRLRNGGLPFLSNSSGARDPKRSERQS
jgi:hypothetical protein